MTRRFMQVLAVLLAVAGVMLALGACYRIGAAHAAAVVTTDGAPSPVVTPAPAFSLPWEAWIALGLAAIAGLRSTIHGVRELLGLFKARTKTTIDDRAYDALGVAEDALTGALSTVRSITGKAPVAALALLLGVAALLPGCASSTRESTIKTAMVAVDASSAAFAAYDKSHQSEIVQHATSLDDGKAKLEVYRKKQDEVRRAFVVAYSAIGAAAALSDEQSIAAMQVALKQVLVAVAALTGGGNP